MRALLLASAMMLAAVCPVHAALQQAQAGGPDPNMHLFQMWEAPRTPSSGTQQFVGWIACTYPAGSADAKTYCNGPNGAQFANVLGLTGLSCQEWIVASRFVSEGGACESADGTWNYAGQCYPYVAYNIKLADCAESKFYCQDTTFFGAKLSASCCPGSSNPGHGKCF